MLKFFASADCEARRFGPANPGRRLDAAERQAIEQKNAGRGAAVKSDFGERGRHRLPRVLTNS
jgi:hypothetical protein